jgi:hypothetical protein
MRTGTTADHASSVADALDALEVPSPTRHIWMGEPADLPEVVSRRADHHGRRRSLVGSIGARLYDSFFTWGAPRPILSEPSPRTHEPGLSYQLAAANTARGWLQSGWRVVAEEEEQWVVQRSDLRLWVTARDVETGGGPLEVGEVVSLRRSSDVPAASPGFYTAHGDLDFPADGPRRFDRVYFDLRQEGAVPFVREVTSRLNGAGLPFIAKVVDDPRCFDRRDAAVVYFDRRDRARALDSTDDLARSLAGFLDGGAPAMTLPLLPGVAFAEDPGGAESFGSHRCLLIADAAVTAAERGLRSLDERLRLVRERFAEAGTSLGAPYLGSPSGDLRSGHGSGAEAPA